MIFEPKAETTNDSGDDEPTGCDAAGVAIGAGEDEIGAEDVEADEAAAGSFCTLLTTALDNGAVLFCAAGAWAAGAAGGAAGAGEAAGSFIDETYAGIAILL